MQLNKTYSYNEIESFSNNNKMHLIDKSEEHIVNEDTLILNGSINNYVFLLISSSKGFFYKLIHITE
jgi:hypothetical protein